MSSLLDRSQPNLKRKRKRRKKTLLRSLITRRKRQRPPRMMSSSGKTWQVTRATTPKTLQRSATAKSRSKTMASYVSLSKFFTQTDVSPVTRINSRSILTSTLATYSSNSTAETKVTLRWKTSTEVSRPISTPKNLNRKCHHRSLNPKRRRRIKRRRKKKRKTMSPIPPTQTLSLMMTCGTP